MWNHEGQCTGQAKAFAAGEVHDVISSAEFDEIAEECQLQIADLDGEVFPEDVDEVIADAVIKLTREHGEHLADWIKEEIEDRVLLS